MKIKQTINKILNTDDSKSGFLYLIDDYFISGLIILNIIAIILESFHPLYSSYKSTFIAFDVFSVIVFTIEYLLRIWIADLNPDGSKRSKPLKQRLSYIFSPIGLTDLLAILPFYIPFIVQLDLRSLRMLRLFRLFRIFKLAHYNESLRLVVRVVKKQKDELLITMFITFILLLITSSVMYHIEHDVQPDKFPNIFATLWWAVATLTTIGYGDVFPVTGWGQFLAAFTALFGIGLVAIPTGILSMGFMEELNKTRNKKKKEKNNKHRELLEELEFNYCPHCGEKLKENNSHDPNC